MISIELRGARSSARRRSVAWTLRRSARIPTSTRQAPCNRLDARATCCPLDSSTETAGVELWHGHRRVLKLGLLALAACGSSGSAESPNTSSNSTSSAGLTDAGLAGDAETSDAATASGEAGLTSLGAIYSGVPWLDTSGNLVNAHGVGFIQVGGTYYMVGEQRSGKNDSYSGAPINAEDTFTGVNMYSTADFVHWTFVGTVVQPIAGTVVAPPYYGERPKILYNSSTKEFVIYIKMLNYTSPGGPDSGTAPVYAGYYAVLTSESVSGPYTYYGTLDLDGADDFQVFQDMDGSQYLVRANGLLYQFAADGLSIASTVAVGVTSGEGVSLYNANGNYFWQSSQGTYWHCNDNSYVVAASLNGLWASDGYFCPAGTMTWESQDTAVIPIVGAAATTYIYVGDRWVNGDLPASTLVMQPLTVMGAFESIPTYAPTWSLDVEAGTWSPVASSGASVNDTAVGTGENQFHFDSNWTYGTCTTGCYDGDMTSSSVANAMATLSFTGTQVLLYSAYDDASGIMGITIDDVAGTPVTPEVQVSLRYDAAPAGNYLVYASPLLPIGSYTLTVRVTGLADFYSSGTACHIDRVVVLP